MDVAAFFRLTYHVWRRRGVVITSTDNRQIKNVSVLMKKAKERKNQGVFVVEGPKMCFEAPFSWVETVYIAESFYRDSEEFGRLEDYIQAAKEEQVSIRYEVVSDSVFKTVSDTQTPQGILAVVRMPEYGLPELRKGGNTLLLVLESIQDPGNLGTMIRTGEGAGVTGVIMNRTTVDLFNPKTIRSTMGSIYRIPFFVAEDLGETVEKVKKAGVRLYAAHLKGKMAYDEPDYTGPCGFLIGNEGNGLSAELADLASGYIRIPMEGNVESLNAAVSASLLVYECNRQRRCALANMV